MQAASSVRLTGAIEVRATLAKDTSTLAFTGRAQIDVTLSPGEVGVVPMTYQWTGTWGSCRWDAAGTDREVRVDYHGLVAGRPVAYISGSPPSVVVPCNDTTWGNSPVWRFNYEGQAAIEPLFNWFEIDDERGTGTFSLGLQQLQTAAGELIRGLRALAPLIQLLADETAARQARSGE